MTIWSTIITFPFEDPTRSPAFIVTTRFMALEVALAVDALNRQ